jgi:AP-4 complex subunit epsilon-1
VSMYQVDPQYALEHQMIVVKCLEEDDETIQGTTLDLLIRMANPKNIMVIAEKLLKFLEEDQDLERRQSLTSRITQLAERFAPDSYWFIDTMNQIFEIGGNLVKSDSAFNLMRLIAEGQGEDEDEDAELRAYAVNCYIDMLAKSQG